VSAAEKERRSWIATRMSGTAIGCESEIAIGIGIANESGTAIGCESEIAIRIGIGSESGTEIENESENETVTGIEIEPAIATANTIILTKTTRSQNGTSLLVLQHP
jgi:hypothetical protein